MPGHGLQNLCGSADDLQDGISHQGLRYPGPDASFEAATSPEPHGNQGRHAGHVVEPMLLVGRPFRRGRGVYWQNLLEVTLSQAFEEDEECTGRTCSK